MLVLFLRLDGAGWALLLAALRAAGGAAFRAQSAAAAVATNAVPVSGAKLHRRDACIGAAGTDVALAQHIQPPAGIAA